MNRSTSSLSYYLNLQYRRLIRTLGDNGIYPWLLLPLILLVFVFISFRLLSGFAFGEYIYSVIGLSLISSIADSRRYNFLKSISTKSDYGIIRLSENLLILFPFIVGLLSFGWFLPAGLLLILGIIASFLNGNISLPHSMPTPFGRLPFEFARGFRRGVIGVIACYALVPIGISANNFNLALASIAVMGLISGSYFNQPELRFYLWIHTEKVDQFLINKSKTVFLYSLMTMLPAAIALSIYDPSRITVILLIIFAAVTFVEMCMLSKYVAYPSEINIVAGLAMTASIFFPPLMLIIVPVFYFKSRRRLNQYLR